jgi:stress-induced morphogen
MPAPREPCALPEGLGAPASGGYDLNVSPADSLQALLSTAFPDAEELSVVDRTGGGDHFQVTITSDRFEGLSLVDQHKLVYAALETPLADGTIHELRIKTRGVS